jgi:DNA-binding CsgD family transcriptional regulator
MALGWMERSPRPILFTNDLLELLWCNAAAARLIDSGQLIRLVGSSIELNDGSHQPALRELLEECDANDSTRILRLSRPATDLLVQARQVGTLAGRKLIGISLYGPAVRSGMRYADLRQVFGLSPGEEAVLLDLLEGHKPEEIAGKRRVSVETIRTQVRSLYLKTGATSREALFSQLRHFAI